VRFPQESHKSEVLRNRISVQLYTVPARVRNSTREQGGSIHVSPKTQLPQTGQ